jgi:hypothetical protein
MNKLRMAVLTRPSVNPVGCNPSGCSHSKERKLAVLEICKKYNLLILEGASGSLTRPVCLAADLPDDPYCQSKRSDHLRTTARHHR